MKKKQYGKNRCLLVLLSLVLALSMVLSGCNSRRRDDASTQTSASQEEEVSSSQEEAEPDEEEPDEEEKESSSEEEEESSSSQASSSSTPASGQTGSGSQSAGQTSGNGNAASSSSTSSKPASSSSSSSSSKPTTSTSTKYKDVTYVKKGGYTKTESFNNAIIKGSGILLKNKTFYGDVTIQSSAGSGGITLENVTVKGTLKVQGGSGTLKLEDCQIHAITLDYKDAKVYATGKTDVSSVLVKRDASLQESEMNKDSDGFENITVSGSGNKILLSLQGMTVDDVETRTGAWVTVNKDARVKDFVAKAPTYVRGTGTVDELTASNNYVYYQYRPDQLSRTGNYRLPRKYDASNNYWDDDDDWSDWDDDEDDDDNDRSDVYIRAISNRTLYEGQTDEISLNTNAYSLTATSDDTSVASVSINSDDDLVVKAKKAGKAKITVKGKRSGYNPDTETFTVTVVSKAPVIQDIAGVPSGWQNSSATISFRVSDDDLKSVTVNGTALSASGGIYRFTAEKNGNYQIVATDQKGNVAKHTVTVSKIDKTKPVISTPQLSNPGVIEAQKTVTFTVTDAGGSALKQVTVNNAEVQPKNGIYSYSVPDNGSYTIRAVDNAGNETTHSFSVTEIDKTKPVIGTPQLSNPGTIELQKTATFTVTDAGGSGIKQVTVNNTAVLPQNGSYSYVVTANGSYTIRAVDNAGNETTHSFSVTGIGQPAVPVPVLTLLSQSPDNATPTSGKVTVQFMVKDLGGNTLAVSPSGTITAVDAANGIYQFIAAANGEYMVTAGRKAAPLKVTVSNIDKSGPAIGVGTLSQSWLPSQTVTFTASDPNGIQSPEVKAPSGAAVLAAGSAGNYSFSASVNGDYTITVRDTLGNESSETITVKRVQPTIQYTDGTTQLPDSLTVGSSGSYHTTLFTIQDTSGKSASQQVSFEYSLSCAAQTRNENPALTVDNGDKDGYAGVLLTPQTTAGKLVYSALPGQLPSYSMTLTPGKQYVLKLRPKIGRQYIMDQNNLPLTWAYTITASSPHG